MSGAYREEPIEVKIERLEKKVKDLELRLTNVEALEEPKSKPPKDYDEATPLFRILIGEDAYQVYDFAYGLRVCPVCNHSKRKNFWSSELERNVGAQMTYKTGLMDVCQKHGVHALFIRMCTSPRCNFKWVVGLRKEV